jgi:predicted nucleic acid-binding protein
MKIVTDTNIVFSALANTTGTLADIIIGSDKTCHFYSNEYLLWKLKKHHVKLQKISKLDDYELEIAQYKLFKYIHFFSLELIPAELYKSIQQ